MKRIAGIGFLLLAIGVALGAFGAHALKDSFVGGEQDTWKTAVFYQLVHSIGILLIVLFEKLDITEGKIAAISSKTMLAGTVIFSGSLYLLVLTKMRWLGAITPIGGILLIGSWLLLAWSSSCRRR